MPGTKTLPRPVPQIGCGWTSRLLGFRDRSPMLPLQSDHTSRTVYFALGWAPFSILQNSHHRTAQQHSAMALIGRHWRCALPFGSRMHGMFKICQTRQDFIRKFGRETHCGSKQRRKEGQKRLIDTRLWTYGWILHNIIQDTIEGLGCWL